MALTRDYIKSQVKKILPIGETDIYDDQLDILVGGAVSKLISEGLDNAAQADGEDLFTEGASDLMYHGCSRDRTCSSNHNHFLS